MIAVMERMSTSSDQGRRAAAQELAALWQRIGSQHLSAAQGCACGFGGLTIQASDFELDIVEFVIGDARKVSRPSVETYIDTVSRRGPDRYSLPALLEAIGKPGAEAQTVPDDLDFILARLRRTLTSIEAAHTNSRFVCD